MNIFNEVNSINNNTEKVLELSKDALEILGWKISESINSMHFAQKTMQLKDVDGSTYQANIIISFDLPLNIYKTLHGFKKRSYSRYPDMVEAFKYQWQNFWVIKNETGEEIEFKKLSRRTINSVDQLNKGINKIIKDLEKGYGIR